MDILQIFELFPTHQACIEYLETARWDNKPECPYCGSDRSGRTGSRHHCYVCRSSYSVTVGTIFHHTHLPLQKWFLAISMILGAKKDISALQLSRSLKVNKNTSWRISMQIRKAMSQSDQRNLLAGVVEMDETYIGGKPRKGSYPPTIHPREVEEPKSLPSSGLLNVGGE